MRLFDPNVEKLEAKRDFDGLIAALAHRKAEIRRLAADAVRRLAKQGIFDVKTVEPLTASLHDADDVVRQNAAFALGDLANQSIAATNIAAVKPLTALLSDPNWKVRWSAAFAVNRLAWRGIFDISSVKPLIGLLSSRSRRIRTNAAYALAYLARSGVSDAWKAHPALKKIASTDSDHRVRKAAKKALAIMRKETLVKLSKLMSYILRHNTEQNYKVELDKGCYVKISQLVHAISSTPEWSWATRKHIEEVANKSHWKNKKRFVIKGDKIKAAYGITRNCPSTSTPEPEPISSSDFTPRPTAPSTFPPELAPSQLQNIATKVAFMLVAPTIAAALLLYGESDIALLFAILGVPVIIIIVFGWYFQSVKQQRLEGPAPHKKTPTTKPTPLPKPTPLEQTSPPEPIPPSDFTPRPTTPSTFPPELAHLYSDPVYAGKGGFARVFKAKRNTDNKTVAIKIPISLDEGTGRSFLREITSWQRLNHENIITLYDANILPIPYLEIEYASSGSLDQMNKPVDVDTASEIILGIADGLSYSHAQGVIHRDLKPLNILLTKDLTPKISDWGLSKIIAESKTSSMYGFSPLYASPEQISPKKFGKPDEKTDIYQLGVIFYELSTGRTPFVGDDLVEVSTSIVTEEPALPSELNPEAKIIEPIILKCLEKKKEDRYQNVGELQSDLASALKIQLKESLKMSVSKQNMKRSVFYCAELCLINARLGEIDEVMMWLKDMQNYASEKIRSDVDGLLDELERRKGMSSEEKISEEFTARLKNLLHQVRMGR